MPHHCPWNREEIRRLTKKSSIKTKNWTEPEENKDKYQSVISEVEELRALSGPFCWTGKNLLHIYVSFYVVTQG